MLAKFEIIGHIGKVAIPERFKDRDCVFLSVATSNMYNGKYYTQWLNNVAAWGARANWLKGRMKPGQLWYLAGEFKSVKKGKKEEIKFNVMQYRMLKESQDEQIETLQKREMDKFQAEVHAYDDYEEEDMYDDLALEQAKKDAIAAKKKRLEEENK